jgi:tRNA-dihydrouridine synthase B
MYLERPILNDKINFPICLAPMVGLSHKVLRLIVKSYLPKGARTLWPTEMLNSRRLPSENLATTLETRRHDSESELSPQILGNEEKFITPSVLKLQDWGAEAIDINMGCPVKKALQHNYGVALMGDADYAKNVVAMTVKSSKLPVSVKLRSGLQEDEAYLLAFVKGLEEAGASWITLHPRIASQQRKGEARWSQIKRVRESLNIPVIGNGDIQVMDDVFDMLNETGCDMVMAGRALTARPWLLWQVGEGLNFENPEGRTGNAPQTPEDEGAEYGRMLLEMLDLYKLEPNRDHALRQFRFFIRTSSIWLEFGNTLFSVVSKAKTLEETSQAVSIFFETPQRMARKTLLRN